MLILAQGCFNALIEVFRRVSPSNQVFALGGNWPNKTANPARNGRLVVLKSMDSRDQHVINSYAHRDLS